MNNPEKINKFITEIKSAEGLEDLALNEYSTPKDAQFSKQHKEHIKELTGKDVIGRGKQSLLLKETGSKLIGIGIKEKKYDKDGEDPRYHVSNADSGDAYERLSHRTFRQKSRYYSNKILTTLFPHNLAKLHVATAGISLSAEDEQKLRKLYIDVPENISSYNMDKRELVEKPRFYDIAKYQYPKSKFEDIIKLLHANHIGVHYDPADQNTIKNRDGHEVYIDEIFLDIETSSDIDKILAFMISQNMQRPNAYSEDDMNTVKNSAERLKTLAEEYRNTVGKDVPVFKQM